MAFSIQRAVSDGTMTLLPVSIEYFDREEISVLFDGVLNARQWEWVGSTDRTLSFTPAVDTGMEVMVVRTTDLSALRHQFSQGAQFTAESMDESLLQILHIAQEAKEGSNLGEIFQNLNFHGFKAVNMGNGTDPGDAVNHAQMQVHDATISGYKDSAAASAAAAAASAAAAAQSEVDTADIVTAAEVQFGLPVGHTAVSKTGDTGAARIPAGTTEQRPSVPVYGETRANSTLNSMEWWNGVAWVPMGGGATGGVGNAAFYENDTTITVDYTITTGKNAMTAGPVTIADGVTVTIPNGSVWSIV